MFRFSARCTRLGLIYLTKVPGRIEAYYKSADSLDSATELNTGHFSDVGGKTTAGCMS